MEVPGYLHCDAVTTTGIRETLGGPGHSVRSSPWTPEMRTLVVRHLTDPLPKTHGPDVSTSPDPRRLYYVCPSGTLPASPVSTSGPSGAGAKCKTCPSTGSKDTNGNLGRYDEPPCLSPLSWALGLYLPSHFRPCPLLRPPTKSRPGGHRPHSRSCRARNKRGTKRWVSGACGPLTRRRVLRLTGRRRGRGRVDSTGS